MTDSHFHESYDAVAAWPLDRVFAANDLVTALAKAAHDARTANTGGA